jgi:hypothetical protein
MIVDALEEMANVVAWWRSIIGDRVSQARMQQHLEWRFPRRPPARDNSM